LPETLAEHGAKVDVVPVYQARMPESVPEEARYFLEFGQVDILTFASSATVHNFAVLVGKEKFQTLAHKAVVAAIGPITAATLEEYGITPQIQPANYTIPALAAAIVEYIAKTKG
jgi:uroporphyrinogen III methyltransferase/synthase